MFGVGRRIGMAALLSWFYAGCLPPVEPVEGEQLWAGRGIENLSMVRIEGAPWVEFRARQRLPEPGRAGSYDLMLVPADGSRPGAPVVRNVWNESPWRLGEGRYWVLRDWRLAPGQNQDVPVSTLSLVGLREGIVADIPDVTDYGLLPDGFMWWKRHQPGTNTTITHLRKGDRERILSEVPGAPTWLHNQVSFIAGKDQTLYLLADLDADPEPLRSGVSRTRESPRRDPLFGRYVAMVVPEASDEAPSERRSPVHVIFDLEERSERKLPGAQICCWLGFEGSQFLYAEGASQDAPARLHRYDVLTEAHEVLDMPRQMADVLSFVHRPASRQRLLTDSQGRVAVWDPEAPSQVRALNLRFLGSQFSPDGRFLAFVDPTTNEPGGEGRLMIVDGDFSQPPRVASPVGTTLRPGNYFWLANRGAPAESDDKYLIVFWARFGRAASDLYFYRPTAPSSERVAQAIRDVSVTPERVFGILRTSQQDLVGDLVRRDLTTGEETLYARSVDRFVIGSGAAMTDPDLLVFYIRNRAPTDMDGIWITPLR